MYQAEVPVHTFQDNSFKLTNAITYVGETSIKDEEHYGNLYSTSLYKGPVGIEGGVYNDNNGNLQYDENGALILDKNNAIPVLEVNKKYMIGEEYSINVTVEGDVYQKGNDIFFATIMALSDNINQFISAIGIYNGYLHIYSYKDSRTDSAKYEYLNKEFIDKGFASIDISKYKNQVMNIQVIAKRSEETKVYINGELILTFKSGDEKFTYNYATIGDLRVGRNLKFTGKIYNFAIYGVALNENEVQENYNEAKKYGI